MLIDGQVIRHLLPRQRSELSVLHVGAHVAEESELYQRLGLGPVTWVEANPKLASALPTRGIGQHDSVYCGAVWSVTGLQMELKVTDNLQSSSLLELAEHTTYYPEIEVSELLAVTTIRLEDLIPETSFFMINLDIQGAELEALRSLGRLLKDVRVIYTEVNREELYEKCPRVEEIDQWLDSHGFKRIITAWTPHGWGDAVYVRRVSPLRRLAARATFTFSQLEWSPPNVVFRQRVLDPAYRIFHRFEARE